jgi:hypothetical protein
MMIVLGECNDKSFCGDFQATATGHLKIGNLWYLVSIANFFEIMKS